MLSDYTDLKDTAQVVHFGCLCYQLLRTSRPCCRLDELACFQTVPGCSSGVRMGKRPLTNLLTEQKLHVIFTGRFMLVLPSMLENSVEHLYFINRHLFSGT